MLYRRSERLEEHLKSVNTLDMFKRSENSQQPVDSDVAYWSESLNMKECMRSLKQLCSLSPHSERLQELCEDSDATQIFYLHLARIARSVEIMGDRAPSLYKNIDEALRGLSDEEYSDTRQAYAVVWSALELDKPALMRDNPFNRLAAKKAAVAEDVAQKAAQELDAAAATETKSKKKAKATPAKKKPCKQQPKKPGR